MRQQKLPNLLLATLIFVIGATPAHAAERCAVMSETAADAVETVFVPDFSISSSTPFRVPPGFDNARAIICERTILAVGPEDYRVPLEGGLPLYIASASATIVLEISGGQFRARVVRGELTDGERASLVDALNRAQQMVRPDQ